MSYYLHEHTAPTKPVLGVKEFLDFAHLDEDLEHELVEELIETARCDAERYTRRSFSPTVWDLYLDDFPETPVIELPRSPVSAVSAFKYINEAGVLTDVPAADYQTDIIREPARIALTSSASWPTVKTDQLNAVIITFTAGYNAIPPKLKLAVKFLVQHYHANRLPKEGDSIPGHVRAMLRRYRVK